MASANKAVIVAYSALCLTTAILSSRYYQSAAIERPIHLSLVSLLLAGAVVYVWSRSVAAQQGSQYSALWSNGNGSTGKITLGRFPSLGNALRSLTRLRPTSSPLLLLLLCVVARTLLWWRAIRTSNCAWDGLQALFPFLLAGYTVLELRPVLLPRIAHDADRRGNGAAKSAAKYAGIVLMWGIAAGNTLGQSEATAGAICPTGWCWERSIPVTQAIRLACDALIMTEVSRLLQDREGRPMVWRLLSTAFFASAGVLIFMIWVSSSIERSNFRWNFALSSVALRDLAVDGTATTVGLLSCIYVLGHSTPLLVALTVSVVSACVQLEMRVLDGTVGEVWSHPVGFITGAGFFIALAALLFVPGPEPSSQNNQLGDTISRRVRLYAVGLAFALVMAQVWFIKLGTPLTSPIGGLIADGRAESDAWIANAKKSASLAEAVAEYRARYEVPPPPNFDKWYSYAMQAKSPIIDDFGQIHRDLLPFWGTSPAILRQRTTYLLEHPRYSFGGLIIKDGNIEISPHILGTHRWMVDVMKDMVEPFAKWLPDMHLAFNLDDECRVAVPYDRMEDYLSEGLSSRSRLNSAEKLASFSKTQDPPWSTDYLSEEKDLWGESSPWFLDRHKSQIYYELVSALCPPNSPANQFHWWDRKVSCRHCSDPHTVSGFVSNWTLSGDLCHQPDLAYLHGFLSSPSAMAASRTLFPVFSQSRIHNFADILYPSPWNFGDKVTFDETRGTPWAEKLNSLYWRGASSDGFALYGAWEGFLRARFVHMVSQASSAGSHALSKFQDLLSSGSAKTDRRRSASSSPPSSRSAAGPLLLNVSFVGPFHGRCEDRDCTQEHITFYGSLANEPPPSQEFDEHWHHRHLADLDGAAFSGRFLPFLHSASLPYRAALFRTWWEERVHAWRHFVPLDVRLVRDLWGVLDYFGGSGSGAGMRDGEAIARAGSEWASKALRKEDMQVYMFRLLLEWGRLVDDRREQLGFGV